MKNRFKFLIALLVALVLFECRGILLIDYDVIEIVEAEGYHNVIPLRRVSRFELYRGCKPWDAAAYIATASDDRGVRYELRVCISSPLPGSSIHPQ